MKIASTKGIGGKKTVSSIGFLGRLSHKIEIILVITSIIGGMWRC